MIGHYALMLGQGSKLMSYRWNSLLVLGCVASGLVSGSNEDSHCSSVRSVLA